MTKANSMITILGIESSCDDTSVSICQDKKILSNIVSTQLIHKEYGGVLPEMASRKHLENILPVFEESIQKAQISLQDIDAIAFTNQPGLLGSLLVGASFAKMLSLCLNIPLIAVNHIEAHILSPLIENKALTFPYLSLTASGGHTQLTLCKDEDTLEVVGKTKDDAIGETLDKVGKMLGLPFPAGKYIDTLALKGNPDKFKFPIVNIENYDYSFSGLKTSALYFLERNQAQNKNFIQENKEDICASFQNAIFETLLKKVFLYSQTHHIDTLCIAGGVASNTMLRKKV